MLFMRSGKKVDLMSNSALAVGRGTGRALEPSNCLVALWETLQTYDAALLEMHGLHTCWKGFLSMIAGDVFIDGIGCTCGTELGGVNSTSYW